MRDVLEPQDGMLDQVRRLPSVLENFRDMLLANLVMIGEIPAPTFGEQRRIEFLGQRFTEAGLQSCSTDSAGNGLGVLPGTQGKKHILVAAHADTPFSANVSHTISVDTDSVKGPGVADNGLGLAVLATLPTILDRLGIRFRYNLTFMGTAQSLGRGNLKGLRDFLAGTELPILTGISVEGCQVGRLNYASLASLNGEITCKVQEDVETGAVAGTGAIGVLTQVIERLKAVPLPETPDTNLVFGAVEGGTSYKKPARSSALRFQVLGESGDWLEEMEGRIRAIVDAVADETGAQVVLEVRARTNAGGLSGEHPLVIQSRRIITALGIPLRPDRYSTSVSSFVEQGIPSITIGISRGKNLNECDESVVIDPMLKGVAQLIGILLAVDGGCCD